VTPLEAVRILQGRPYMKTSKYPLDNFYMLMLSKVPHSVEQPALYKRYQDIVGQLIVAAEPFSITSFLALEGKGFHSLQVTQMTLQHFGAFLLGTDSLDEPVRPVHSSFRDFLYDEHRSSAAHLDLASAHTHLAELCFQRMKQGLHFDMIGFPSSFISNSDLKHMQLEHPSSVHLLPTELLYSCLYWSYHLQYAKPSTYLLQQCVLFLKGNFTFWLEVLSWDGQIARSGIAMNIVRKWATAMTVSVLDRKVCQGSISL
jgi:hypothetical protein